MFIVPIEELIANLEALRAKVCTYSGPTCDCKFGVNDREGTGCPELRQVLEMLRPTGCDAEWAKP